MRGGEWGESQKREQGRSGLLWNKGDYGRYHRSMTWSTTVDHQNGDGDDGSSY